MPYDQYGEWYQDPNQPVYNPASPGAGVSYDQYGQPYVTTTPQAAPASSAGPAGPTAPAGPAPIQHQSPEQDQAQLAWMMSLYGLDASNPDDVTKFQNQWNGATTIPGSNLPNSPAGQATAAENKRQNDRSVPVSQSQNWGLLDDYNTSREGANAAPITNYWASVNQTNAGNNALMAPVQQSAGKVQTAADALGAQTAGWQGQSAASAAGANAADRQTLGTYQNSVNGLTQFSDQNYSSYANALNSQPILQAGGYGADVQSQAANARANPQDIANQYSAYQQLAEIGAGSYDYNSQASMAKADPWADQNYRNGIVGLQNIANGSKDVRVGETDPDAYAAAVDARGKLKDLTSPTLTAAERFIYEQGRLQQEQGERSLRGARVNNLRERGLGGGASEQLAGQLGARQMSQNAMLGGLGAMANAQARSMQALSGYAGLSSAMNAQANQLGTSNADRQLAAQGMYVDASGQLRRDTFQESYQKGVAADRATEFNTSMRFAGTQAQGNLATNMRNQSFSEDFSTKSAADSMAQFNKAQSQVSQRWQEQYAADQQQAYTNRQTGINQAGQANANFGLNAANGVANAGFGVNAAADQRTQGSLMNQNALGTSAINGYGAAANAALGAGQFGYTTNQGNLANTAGATSLQITDNNAITNRGVASHLNKQSANAGDTGLAITGGYNPEKLDDGYDNDFDRWQNGK